MDVSVIVPAHNEAELLPRCLSSIARAQSNLNSPVEVVVVANRCTDATAEIAHFQGAMVVDDQSRNIATVRNAGVRASSGRFVVTIDADNIVAPNALSAVHSQLATGHVVGGGTAFQPERRSLGINATYAITLALTRLARVSGVMFWCTREDFEAIGGFNESLSVGEDVDFARRLRRLGRASGRKFVTLNDAPVTISTRKFDRFGDWHMFKMAGELPAILRSLRGRDTEWVDRYFFDYNGEDPPTSL